eukprot:GHVS01026017.1.p1 GENE.GHVS01026017.1~~GHVS01026017.1.p1  ORF type:complete len:783 (+),score=216.81 GHVS01026017.1:510-2858(+)
MSLLQRFHSRRKSSSTLKANNGNPLPPSPPPDSPDKHGSKPPCSSSAVSNGAGGAPNASSFSSSSSSFSFGSNGNGPIRPIVPSVDMEAIPCRGGEETSVVCFHGGVVYPPTADDCFGMREGEETKCREEQGYRSSAADILAGAKYTSSDLQPSTINDNNKDTGNSGNSNNGNSNNGNSNNGNSNNGNSNNGNSNNSKAPLHTPLCGRVIVSQMCRAYTLPEAAVLFEPSSADIFSDKHARLIFANTPVSEKECGELTSFKQHLAETGVVVPKWMEQQFLRLLYAADFSYEKATELVKANYLFRMSSELPVREEEVFEALHTGCMYWHGRDRRGRPILVVHVNKLEAVQDRFTKLLVFCFEFFLKFLAVAGRIESWMVLVDCAGKGITNFPVGQIRHMIECLNARYRGRMFRMFVVNAPTLVNVVSRPLLAALPASTSRKIRLYSSNFRTDLAALVLSSQREAKYGGSQPDLTHSFYPFHFFPNFSDPKEQSHIPPTAATSITDKLHDVLPPHVQSGLDLSLVVNETPSATVDARTELLHKLRCLNLTASCASWLSVHLRTPFSATTSVLSLLPSSSSSSTLCYSMSRQSSTISYSPHNNATHWRSQHKQQPPLINRSFSSTNHSTSSSSKEIMLSSPSRHKSTTTTTTAAVAAVADPTALVMQSSPPHIAPPHHNPPPPSKLGGSSPSSSSHKHHHHQHSAPKLNRSATSTSHHPLSSSSSAQLPAFLHPSPSSSSSHHAAAAQPTAAAAVAKPPRVFAHSQADRRAMSGVGEEGRRSQKG